jgi:hypothetical protein
MKSEESRFTTCSIYIIYSFFVTYYMLRYNADLDLVKLELCYSFNKYQSVLISY